MQAAVEVIAAVLDIDYGSLLFVMQRVFRASNNVVAVLSISSPRSPGKPTVDFFLFLVAKNSWHQAQLLI